LCGYKNPKTRKALFKKGALRVDGADNSSPPANSHLIFEI
jgi:hypothetical protein